MMEIIKKIIFRFKLHSISKNVARFNKVFGGFRPNVTNVFFTNGQVCRLGAKGFDDKL